MKQTRYHRGGAVLFSAAVAFGACAHEAKEIPLPSAIPTTTEPTEIETYIQPSVDGILIVLEKPEKFKDIGLLAGIFACNKMGLQIREIDGEPLAYVGPFVDITVPAAVADDFATKIQDVSTNYEITTGDHGYKDWYGVFQDVHAEVASNPDKYCAT